MSSRSKAAGATDGADEGSVVRDSGRTPGHPERAKPRKRAARKTTKAAEPTATPESGTAESSTAEPSAAEPGTAANPEPTSPEPTSPEPTKAGAGKAPGSARRSRRAGRSRRTGARSTSGAQSSGDSGESGESGRGATIAVTGAASGIGLAFVRHLIARQQRQPDQPSQLGLLGRLVGLGRAGQPATRDAAEPADSAQNVAAQTPDARADAQADAAADLETQHAEPPAPGEVRRVVALDDHRGDAEGAEWRVVDIRDPSLATRIEGCDVVVHLDLDHSPDADPKARSAHNVRGAQTVLTAAAAAGVPRVVLCTSATVYGAEADNPVPLDEDAPLKARPEGIVADLLEIEWLARRAPKTHPGLTVTVVRPAMLVGAGVDTFLTRHFESPRLLVIRGSKPTWQFCHVDDLVTALEWAALGKVEGAVTCGCDGTLEQAEVEELFGVQHLELPERLALGAAERLHRLGLTPAPATELSYVSHPWVVSSKRLLDAGWRPGYDNIMAAVSLAEQVAGRRTALGRRIGRPSNATLGAAGATVALLGTAAVVARKRKRKRQQ